jgi:hypothetical protein
MCQVILKNINNNRTNFPVHMSSPWVGVCLLLGKLAVGVTLPETVHGVSRKLINTDMTWNYRLSRQMLDSCDKQITQTDRLG